MAAKILSEEELIKKYGPMPTTISTVSPEEFGRRMSAYWQKVKAEEAKTKAEAEAKATPSHTEK